MYISNRPSGSSMVILIKMGGCILSVGVVDIKTIPKLPGPSKMSSSTTKILMQAIPGVPVGNMADKLPLKLKSEPSTVSISEW